MPTCHPADRAVADCEAKGQFALPASRGCDSGLGISRPGGSLDSRQVNLNNGIALDLRKDLANKRREPVPHIAASSRRNVGETTEACF
jgi:hypothetical protein